MSIKQVVRDFYEKSGCALHYEKAAEKLGIDAKVVCTAIWSLKQDGSLTPTTRRGVYKINTGQLPPIIKMEAQPKSEPQVEALPVEPVQEPQPQSQPELEPKGPIYLVAMLSFEDHEFRTIERNGERLWVLADVCDANDIGNPSKVASRLNEDEKDTITLRDSMGRPRDVLVVNEAGLYEAMRPSQRPFAKRFWHWVCHEGLPSI